MAIDSVANLITELDQSRLLEAPQLDELNRKVQGRAVEPRVLAQKLIDSGWLTPYQVNTLFQGKGQELTLGPYVLLERVGEGGMGSVFKARHQKLKRIGALKVIRKEWLSQPEAVRRFQREIRAASQLHHPNIVHAFDAGQLGDTHYIAMEFVDGLDLARLVKRDGPLPVEQACDFIRQSALGLQHAHEKQLVHRDIKPGNLLLTQTGAPTFEGPWGTIKILDMGLARVLRPAEDADSTASGTLTQAGSVVGTPDYIAPEQARDSRTVDIRADIYSLGCTFFFLLTGQVPFPGGTGMEKLFKHQLDPPPPIESLRPGLPAGVSAIIRRLLAKKPEDRYQIPVELAQALEPFCKPDAEHITAAPVPQSLRPTRATQEDATPSEQPIAVPPPRKTVMSRPRRRRWLWAAPFAALIVLGGLAIVLSQLGGSSKTVETTSATPGGPAGPVKWSLDSLEHKDIPTAERVPGLPPEVVAVLGEHRMRNWGMTGILAYSPDSRYVAAGNARMLRIWDTVTGQQTALLTSPGSALWLQGLAFSADGKSLTAYSYGEPLRTWDVASGRLVTTRNISADGMVIALSPDTNSAVVRDKAGTDIRSRLWDLVEDRERADLGPFGAAPTYSYSANGRYLVAWKRLFGAGGMMNNEIAVWEVATGKEVNHFSLEKETPAAVHLAPDGQTVAIGLATGRVELWEVAKGRKLVTREPPVARAYVRQIAFAPDGRTVATFWQHFEVGQVSREYVKLWNAADGQEISTLPAELSPISSLQFAPDGKSLALTGQGTRIIIWDLAAGKERFPARPGSRSNVTNVAFAPDGRHVMTAAYGVEGGLRLFDLETGKERVVTNEPVVWGGLFAPDRQTAVTRGDEWVSLWNTVTGEKLGTLPALKNNTTLVTVAPTGNVLATYNSGEPGARLHELPSLKARCALQGAAGPTMLLAFSGDGRSLVTVGYNGKPQLWDAATGKPRTVTLAGAANTSRVYQAALSHDGKWLAVVTENQFHVWDTQTGEARTPASLPEGRVAFAQFSPVGDKLLMASGQQVKLWDLAQRGGPQTLKSGGEMFGSFLWSPDGKRLVATEADGKLTLWDTSANHDPRRITLPGPASQVSFAPDGRHLATANANGTIYVIRVAP